MNAYCNISYVLPGLADRLGIAATNRVLRSIGMDRLVFAIDCPDSKWLQPTEIYETFFDILGKMVFPWKKQNAYANTMRKRSLRMNKRFRFANR